MARATTDRDASRELRRNQTGAERVMWNVLRDRRLLNLKFRRQHPIGNYIADFCCIEKGLIIELDGSQHEERAAYDDERTKWLNEHGFRVLRFTNGDVLPNPDGAIEQIRNHILNPLPKGEVGGRSEPGEGPLKI